MGDDKLSIERYGEALAYKRSYEARDFVEILSRLRASSGAFDAAAAHWSGVIAKELAGGDPTSLLRFARAYARAEQRIRSRKPRLEAIEPLDDLDRAAPETPRVAEPRMRKLDRAEEPSPNGAHAPQRVETPTYKLSEQIPAPPPSQQRWGDEFSTVLADASIRSFDLPFAPPSTRLEGTSGPDSAPASAPASSDARPSGPATVMLGDAAPLVPFKGFVEYRVELEQCGSEGEAAKRAKLSEPERVAAEAYWGPRLAQEPDIQRAFEALRDALGRR
jgi:hypothetical protein